MRFQSQCLVLLIAVLSLPSLERSAWSGELHRVDGPMLRGDLHLYAAHVEVVAADGQRSTVPLKQVDQLRFSEEPGPRHSAFQPVLVLTNAAVDLNQATEDALNGLTGMLLRDKPNRNHTNRQKPKARRGLSDARTPQSPDKDHGWFSGEVTWDLGSTVPAEENQLDSVVVWTGSDKSRCDYYGAFAVSRDGQLFQTIPETAKSINYEQLREERKRTKQKVGDFNRTEFRFPPGRVVGFRYLKFMAHRSQRTGCDTRFVEIDAQVSRVPPGTYKPLAVVRMVNGTEVCGVIRDLDDRSVQLEMEGDQDIRLPLHRVASLEFVRLAPALMGRLVPGRRGVVLADQDFFEGALVEMDRHIVSIDSVLFGRREFRCAQDVLALVLNRLDPVNSAFLLTTTDGSRLRVDQWKRVGDQLVIEDSLAGSIRIPLNAIFGLERCSPTPTKPD